MGYSIRILNYPKRIILSDLTHIMSMPDLVAICVGAPRIDSGCSLKKEFIELIRMNPLIILCQIVNQVDSCHGCVRGPLT